MSKPSLPHSELNLYRGLALYIDSILEGIEATQLSGGSGAIVTLGAYNDDFLP